MSRPNSAADGRCLRSRGRRLGALGILLLAGCIHGPSNEVAPPPPPPPPPPALERLYEEIRLAAQREDSLRAEVEALYRALRTVRDEMNAVVARAEGPSMADIPRLDLPVPRPSAHYALPDRFFRPAGPSPRLRDVDDRLRSALESRGYFEISYYAVPGGFALVPRPEQIDLDATSREGADRWNTDYAPPRWFDVGALLDALRNQVRGEWRLFLFVVTNVEIEKGTVGLGFQEALLWMGGERLPAEIADMAFSRDHRVSVYVYEFQKPGEGADATQCVPGRLQTMDHLVRSGLWDALSGDEPLPEAVRASGTLGATCPQLTSESSDA